MALLLAMHLPAWSASTDEYRLGVDAFKQGRYEAARDHFTAAYHAGRRDATLLYNLGSAQFKLGDYQAAYGSFARIANDPTWGPLALYNLGLVDEKLHHEERAQQHFRAAYEAAQSPKLKQLAALKMGTARQSVEPDNDDWFGIASIAGGFDDNVVLLNDQSLQSVSNQQDYFAEALASASSFVTGSVDGGWRADFSGYYRAYRDQTDYDYGVASTALVYNRISGNSQWQLGGKADAQFVGGDAYTASGSLRAQIMRPIGAVILRVRNDIAYVDGASNFGYLTGWQDRLGLQMGGKIGRTALRLGYELELNNRRDDSTATEFFSYSPTWNRFYADATQPFSDAFDLSLRADYQFSRYRDDNVQVNADGSVSIAARDDDRITASLRVTYHPSNTWGVFSEYVYANNSSKFSEYEYDDNQILIGIERPF
jgi:tetratricopeptide (TPR) repeat protein